MQTVNVYAASKLFLSVLIPFYSMVIICNLFLAFVRVCWLVIVHCKCFLALCRHQWLPFKAFSSWELQACLGMYSCGYWLFSVLSTIERSAVSIAGFAVAGFPVFPVFSTAQACIALCSYCSLCCALRCARRVSVRSLRFSPPNSSLGNFFYVFTYVFC